MTSLDVLSDVLRPHPPDAGHPTDVDWEAVLPLAADHDLLPALWSAGVARGWWTPLPADALERVLTRFSPGLTQPPLLLQQAHDTNRIRIGDLMEQGRDILDHLASAGIAAIPLKGWHAVMAGWWADPADRVMRDLDVLVPADQAERAADGLAELGYVPLATGHTPEADHELPAVHLPGRPGSVELHTALVVRRWRDVLPAGEVLGPGAPMSTTDAVIHSIAHAQLHDEAHLLAHIPLRALHELSVLAAGPRADEIEWWRVRSAFRGVSAEPALDAHLAMARSLFAAAVPAPEGRLRAEAHDRLCRALLARPPVASVYEKTVFLPRGLSTARMHELHGPGNPWLARLRHVGRALTRGVRSRRSP